METQDRKYFGMTIRQLGILGGLAVFACLLFGVTGFLAIRKSLSPQPTEMIVRSTATPFVLPTLAPTATLTPIPYGQLVPEGWEQYKTTLVELWLPAGFMNTDKNTQSFVSGNMALRELSLLGSSPTTAKDTVQVSVSWEPLVNDSLDALLTERLSRLPEGVRLAERHKVQIDSVDVDRLLFEWNNGTNDLLYVFLDGSTVWYVKYSADIKDFFELLPVFDDSVKTFRIVR